MWKAIQAAPADAIFGLAEAYKKDSNPDKVNLSVGVYRDDNNQTPVLGAVKKAEERLLTTETTKSYLPISGTSGYSACVQRLLFGDGHAVIKEKRAATAHTPGGTGALRVGANLLKNFVPDAAVWLSQPTWANHRGVFNAAGFTLKEYAYYSPATMGLDVETLMETLKGVAAGDIVLLHACCHNPTGVDVDREQWDEVAKIAAEQGWIPFLDFAYQGFGQGVEEDRQAVLAFADAGIDFFVASSFSKNFGLYNERVGALTVVTASAEETVVALSHLKGVVRVLYSNPPAHGGLVVTTILEDPGLTADWRQELQTMRDRIVTMRAALVKGLAARGIEQDFSYITSQRGMFSFSGLDDGTVQWLRENRSVYVVGGGRINVAGLTRTNIDYVCDAVAAALQR